MLEDIESYLMSVLLMPVTRSGSVRVDLVGGTLDLDPINLILPNVVTLNVATSLKAEVFVEKSAGNQITIHSEDYSKDYNIALSELTSENLYETNHFKEMTFLLQIIDYFKIKHGLNIKLKSGAPAGSGLGGSSAMGVTFFSAMSELLNLEISSVNKIRIVKAIEARILGQGVTGYQDYYPALTGGVLGLVSKPGLVEVDQLYSRELSDFLENHITLIYSGISRDSGINNWDVYKSFFDGSETVKSSLRDIAAVSFKTYNAIKSKDFYPILEMIGDEGKLREKLSENIVPSRVRTFFNLINERQGVLGMKMCGAGGGGCFIVTHEKELRTFIETQAQVADFKVLDFEVDRPI